MKYLRLILTSVALILFANISYAQDTTNYFVGDWEVIVTGTPNGESKMILHLEMVDGKLGGEMRNEQGSDPTKINKIEIKESSITLYYSAGGYDIHLFLEKVDDNNIKGSLMEMFEASGKRVEKDC